MAIKCTTDNICKATQPNSPAAKQAGHHRQTAEATPPTKNPTNKPSHNASQRTFASQQPPHEATPPLHTQQFLSRTQMKITCYPWSSRSLLVLHTMRGTHDKVTCSCHTRGRYGTRKSVPFEFPTPCSLEGYSAAGGELAPHRALHQRAYTHNPTAWCTATAPSPVHHVLTFRLSHPCCRVRTDQLPFERDVRRSSRRTSTDAIQAAQMALVMAIDSLIGGELGRASSPASHSGQAVGGLTR